MWVFRNKACCWVSFCHTLKFVISFHISPKRRDSFFSNLSLQGAGKFFLRKSDFNCQILRELQFIKARLFFFTNCSSPEPEKSDLYLYRTVNSILPGCRCDIAESV
jgi:hypothetical protein